MTTGTIPQGHSAAPDPQTSRTRFYVMAAIVVAGVLVGGLLLFRSGSASEVNLTSAQLVPEDASVFVGINTDLDSSQWVAAFRLAKKLGAEDPEKDLITSAEESGLDWEHEVRPFLGGDAAFFITGLGDGSEVFGDEAAPFRGGVIIKAKNASAALAVIRDQAAGQGIRFDRVEFGGGSYEAASDGSLFMAIFTEHLVVTMDERSLRDVIDVTQGRKGSLADNEVFRDVRDSITRNFIAFTYYDPARLLDGSTEFKDALKDAGFDVDGATPYAGAITAEKNAFAFQQAIPGSADAPPALQPRESKLVRLVPAKTVLFASTSGVASMWTNVPAGNSLSDFLPPFGLPFGEDIAEPFEGDDAPTIDRADVDALMALFTGETAVAVWDAGDLEPQGALLAEVSDGSRAKDLAIKLLGSGASAPVSEHLVNGVTIYGVSGSAVAVVDGVLVAGTATGVDEIVSGPRERLNSALAYTDAVARLPTPLGSFLFLNFAPLFDDESLDLPIADALQSLIINVVQSEGFGRASGALTVKE